jgi:hypothetical protein
MDIGTFDFTTGINGYVRHHSKKIQTSVNDFEKRKERKIGKLKTIKSKQI